jgi:chaperone required for assembly of F1-ATPase
VKRFYRTVDTVPEGVGYVVRLDERPVRTPARHVLTLPTSALAETVAQEWRGQNEEIVPAAMPLTRLATTTLDLMPGRRGDAVDEAAGYAGTDLLCYRAADPRTLVERQEAAWQPWLDWAQRQHDATLIVAHTIDPLQQPATALLALRGAVERLDDWRLVGLHAAATLTGSLVLALALEGGLIDAGRLFEAALLDELYEIERWGEEPQQRQRHANLRRDLEAAERFLRLLPC